MSPGDTDCSKKERERESIINSKNEKGTLLQVIQTLKRSEKNFTKLMQTNWKVCEDIKFLEKHIPLH